MIKYLSTYLYVFLFLFSIQAQDDNREQNTNSNTTLSKPTSIFDRAVGFMDAGKMKIHGVENFGLLSGYDHPGYQNWYPGAYHGDWGEVRWIAPAILMPPGPWGAQSTRGPSLPDDRSDQYNAIESFSAIHLHAGDGINFTDWEGYDNANEYYHGPLLQNNIPMVATSTFPESWPEGYFDENDNWISTPGEHHWPGGWALNPDPNSPDYGKPIEGEFVSNKDIFLISSDKYNGVRSGAITATYGYPVGIDMEVAGYSYSTPLYENIVFFNINFIYRTSDQLTNPDSRFYDPDRHFYDGQIDSVYFAFFVDPDLPGRYLVTGSNFRQANPWAEDDYGLIYDYDGDGTIDVFLAFDKKDEFSDETYPQNTGPVSAYGINFFKTPLLNPGNPNSPEIGITGFHWFDQDEAMRPALVDAQWEKTLYAISSGNPSLIPADRHPEYWFHGADPKIDEIEMLKDYQEGFPEGSRPDIQFWFSSGPFSIQPGDTIPIHIGIVGGQPDPGPLDPDGFATNPPDIRFSSIFDALSQADVLYENNFIGFKPPSSPTLSAVGTEVLDKDGLPVVYGENEKVTLYWDDLAEQSFEIVTKKFDFEGYRIYKTQADVGGQGDPEWGTPIYDYTGTQIIGYQPLAQYDLINEWDGADPLNPFFDLGKNSGLKYTFVDNDVLNGVRYRYTITAYDQPDLTAGQASLESSRGNDPRLVQTIDVIPGLQPQGFKGAQIDSNITHLSGDATGIVSVEVIDPFQVSGHTYDIYFKDSLENVSFDIYDIDEQEYIITDFSNIWQEAELNIVEPRPIFDGIGLKIINHNVIEQLTQGWITVTGDTSDYEFGVMTSVEDSSEVAADYVIVFGDSSSKFSQIPTAQKVPFQIFNITNDSLKQNPLELFVRNPGFPWQSGDYIYLLEPDISNRTWQFIVDWDTSSTAPSTGDEYKYTIKKSFDNLDSYRISTDAFTVSNNKPNMSKIKVVPNPYIVYSIAEQATEQQDRFRHELRFTHLPKECKIRIYTLRGDLVKTIEHKSNTIGEARWNLQTDEKLEVAYGIYIYTIETPKGDKKIGKFAIIW